eukprot:c52796_g1_i1 orf=54-245(+)
MFLGLESQILQWITYLPYRNNLSSPLNILKIDQIKEEKGIGTPKYRKTKHSFYINLPFWKELS